MLNIVVLGLNCNGLQQRFWRPKILQRVQKMIYYKSTAIYAGWLLDNVKSHHALDIG